MHGNSLGEGLSIAPTSDCQRKSETLRFTTANSTATATAIALTRQVDDARAREICDAAAHQQVPFVPQCARPPGLRPRPMCHHRVDQRSDHHGIYQVYFRSSTAGKTRWRRKKVTVHGACANRTTTGQGRARRSRIRHD